jgi:hypothetical protein
MRPREVRKVAGPPGREALTAERDRVKGRERG